MPLFKSKEERQAIKQAKIAKLEAEMAQIDTEMAQIDTERAQIDTERAQIATELAEIKAHNKEVLQRTWQNVKDANDKGREERQQIFREGHERRAERRNNHDN